MRYRVYIHEDIVGDKYYGVQKKEGVFGQWWHVPFSLGDSLKEATALKILLENGESVFSIFKPSSRVNLEMFNV